MDAAEARDFPTKHFCQTGNFPVKGFCLALYILQWLYILLLPDVRRPRRGCRAWPNREE